MKTEYCGRLLLCDQYPDIGGGQTIYLSVAEAARAGGWRCSLYYPPGGSLEETCRQRMGEDVDYLRAPQLNLTRGRKTASDILKFLGYSAALASKRSMASSVDVVYVNGPRQFLGMMWLSWYVQRPFIYHVHLDHSAAEKRLLAALARSRWTAALVVNSQFVLGRLIEAVPGLADNPRLRLVENALDRRSSMLSFKNRFEQHTGRLSVAVVGMLDDSKGTDIAVRAAAVNPLIDMHLIGTAPRGGEAYEKELRQQASGNVFFHGFKADVLRAFDELGIQVVLMPSRRSESFGMAIVEAMAASCIAVSSSAGALLDIGKRTGAFVGRTEEDLFRFLTELSSSSLEKLTETAYRQHKATIDHFGYRRFESEIHNLLLDSKAHRPDNM